MNDVEIPRYYFDGEGTPDIVELHGFSDASQQAYTAVVYLRIVSNGKVVTRLIAAKTRVAPLKRQSIPWLELLSALILTRLINTILKNCPQISVITCWIDSTAALFWIKSDKPLKQYVSRRVKEIQESTCRGQWRHCPGILDPADLPSRGLDAQKLSTCSMWWEGPAFLRLSSEDWPK